MIPETDRADGEQIRTLTYPRSVLLHCGYSSWFSVRRQVTQVEPAFDIFRRESDGLKWLGMAETLVQAREKILQDSSRSEYQFVVINSATGEKTVIEPPERPEAAHG